MYYGILQLFPKEMRDFFETVACREKYVSEIKLRAQKPVLVVEGEREWFLDERGAYTQERLKAKIMEKEALDRIVQHICHYSMYAFEEELRQGYITVAGGHRIGMVGQVVLETPDKIRTIKYICGMNIRISHQIKGVAEQVLPFLYKNGSPRSILLVSPPGCGKTTLLRDIVRNLSDGNAYGRGVTVGVVDERSEIGGSYLGQPQNDVGMRTDILDACPKVLGMMMLLRSMSPRVIAIDELGSEQELAAVKVAASCGSKVVATMHGDCMEDVKRRGTMEKILGEGLFETIFFLGRQKGSCGVKHIYEIMENGSWTCRK